MPRRSVSPFLDPALKSPQLTVGKYAGELTLEPHEEVFADTVALGFEPGAHTRPHAGEGIRPGGSITCRPRCDAMCRSDFTVLPRRRQSREKPFEAVVVGRRHVGGLTRGQCGQVMLH